MCQIILAVWMLFITVMPATAEAFELSRRAYAAFRCSMLAHVATKFDPLKLVGAEQEARLFVLGVEQSRNYAAKVLAGEVDRQRDVLDGFRWSLAGPSADFLAGRLVEHAQSEVVEELPKRPITLEWTAESSEVASKKFSKENCDSLR